MRSASSQAPKLNRHDRDNNLTLDALLSAFCQGVVVLRKFSRLSTTRCPGTGLWISGSGLPVRRVHIQSVRYLHPCHLGNYTVRSNARLKRLRIMTVLGNDDEQASDGQKIESKSNLRMASVTTALPTALRLHSRWRRVYIGSRRRSDEWNCT